MAFFLLFKICTGTAAMLYLAVKNEKYKKYKQKNRYQKQNFEGNHRFEKRS